LAGKSPQELIAGYLVRPYPAAPTTVVSGSIHAPKDFNGVIFVGLFPSRIPQGRPSSGELLFNQGRFELRWDATHRVGHVLAAAFPLASDVLQYLLPPQECVLVTSSVLVRKAPSADVSPPDLSLRQLSPLDPPILIALPVLLRS
ncbi:MAG: hypothetical protein L0Y67_01320, partial [Gammaproteobacteria bacterium]|nr:hypothetical protein [Gammaproteobacteria bacterium]